jgi:hypothetical protein
MRMLNEVKDTSADVVHDAAAECAGAAIESAQHGAVRSGVQSFVLGSSNVAIAHDEPSP